MAHVSVMMDEVLKYLDPKPNQNFVDCTLGDGGHAAAILEHTAPNGMVLGIDADREAIESVLHNPSQPPLTLRGGDDRLVAVHGNFRNLAAIVKEKKFGPVHGIFLDLGFSSSTLERARGFSFEKDEMLDMRFNTTHGIRAAEIVNGWNQKQLQEMLEEYGEERLARQIAERIVLERKKQPIVTTKQLVDVVLMVYREKLTPEVSSRAGSRDLTRYWKARGEISRLPRRGGGSARNDEVRVPWIGGIHPATRTFQALRIEVNDELGALQEVLPQAVDILAPGGRLAVIAFHSLEDRIVKQFFRDWPDAKLKILTKKPLIAGEEEIKNNPRARSAKLRVIEKV